MKWRNIKWIMDGDDGKECKCFSSTESQDMGIIKKNIETEYPNRNIRDIEFDK